MGKQGTCFGSKVYVTYFALVGGHTSPIHQTVCLISGHFLYVVFSSIKK